MKPQPFPRKLPATAPAEQVVKEIRRQTRRHFSAEDKIRSGELEAQIETFVEHYNHQRYHESLNNVTPADAYFGKAPAIIRQRETIKRKTIEHQHLQHRRLAA